MSIFDRLKALLGMTRPDAEEVDAAAEPATPEEPSREETPIPAAAASSTPPEPEAAEEGSTPRKAARAEEDRRIESAARALFAKEDAAAAIAFLREHAVMFARHEPAPTSLPCLCVRCLDAGRGEASSGGVDYVRDFVVTQHRVLFYWSPKELVGDARQLRASMRSELRRQLRVRATKEDEPRETINPFTKQPVTIMPRRRKRINPFTGKPVP